MRSPVISVLQRSRPIQFLTLTCQISTNNQGSAHKNLQQPADAADLSKASKAKSGSRDQRQTGISHMHAVDK
ncbi:hypothetical protein ACJ72_01222 [Emergomyces africanus]|uniref:Uncharacterized protein n=1 Tax=Emergomyces africanus TaxID=1955775 RepID=A0A1B7P5U3_9EURO|nr:hypothetical protein ACJ72_01222 [Emergomyces africanus]